MVSQEKLLVIGMGSSSDRGAFDKVSLDGQSIPDYFRERNIKIYYHPEANDFLTTSIHRVHDRAIAFADDMNKLVVKEGHRLACLFYGGLALAAPGVVAAEAYAVPVIGVPADEDAFYNTYKIPSGNGETTVRIKGLEEALRLAGKILTLEPVSQVRFVHGSDCSSAKDVQELLGRFVDCYEGKLDPTKPCDGLTVGLAGTVADLLSLDKTLESGLSIIGLEKTFATRSALSVVKPETEEKYQVRHSLLVGLPMNLAMAAARIVAGYDPAVREKLRLFREKEGEKLQKHIPMKPEHFK